jgi:hypothetical protein
MVKSLLMHLYSRLFQPGLKIAIFSFGLQPGTKGGCKPGLKRVFPAVSVVDGVYVDRHHKMSIAISLISYIYIGLYLNVYIGIYIIGTVSKNKI